MTDLAFWLVMLGVTLATSFLSGVLGMAGGMVLLAVLLLRFEPGVAIPVHGIVQLFSNASRAWFLREHIRARVLLPFCWPLLPAAALGVFLLGRLPPAVGRVLIGAFVLSATLRPAPSQASVKKRIPPERLLPVGGALVGFFSTLVGATGPLLGPFIVALELSPQGTVGTMAACQVFQHASKVLVFGFAGFDFQRQIWPALGLSLCAIAGSALGTRWLDRVDRHLFKRAVKVVLIVLSLQLLGSGLWELSGASSPDAPNRTR